MEFFEYVRIPQYIIQLLRQFIDTSSTAGISLEEFYILLAVAGGAYLFCLILGGLSLYEMAERAGIKHSWLGFLPFVNTYYAGKVAGETSFFGRKMKRAGLYAMLAEIVYCVLEGCSLVASALLSNPAYFETNIIGGSSTLIQDIANVPVGLRWLVSGSTWFAILALIFNLVMLVLLVALYMGLYRKYSPRNSFWMTIVSVLLPVRAFVLFSVRNTPAIDYDEYMAERFKDAMRSMGVEIQEGKPTDPFEGMTPPESPFSEFDDPSEPPSDAPFSSPFDIFGAPFGSNTDRDDHDGHDDSDDHFNDDSQ